MPLEDRAELGKKCRDYALSEFGHQKTIDLWDETLTNLVTNWKKSPPARWSIQEINSQDSRGKNN